jgi:predicted exporter
LLPEARRSPVVERAWRRFADNIGKQVIFLVGGPTRARAVRGAAQLDAGLRASGLFDAVTFRVDPAMQGAALDLYLPHQTGLLAPGDRARLAADDGAALAARALDAWYSPVSAASSALSGRDPFLLFPEFMQHLPRSAAALGPGGEILFRDAAGGEYVLVSAVVKGNPFAFSDQASLISLLRTLKREVLTDHPGLSLLGTGSVYYAEAAGSDARREIGIIGVGSLLGIIVLMLATFRTVAPLWLSVLSVGCGMLMAVGVTALLFDRMHLFTLVFGASLIGVSVDYALHFFAARLAGEPTQGKAVLARILPGISLGLLTSVIAYAALAVPPFPGLRQLAVFSSIGLIGACLTVVLVFPLAKLRAAVAGDVWLCRLGTRQLAWWTDLNRPARALPVLAVVVLIGIGAWRVDVQDDVRLLQSRAPALFAEETALRGIIGQAYSNQLLVLHADNAEALLQKGERVTGRLAALRGQAIDGYRAVSDFVPSAARQAENREWVRRRLIGPYLDELADAAGLSGTAVTQVRQNWSRQVAPLRPADWLANPVSQPYRYLWVEDAGGDASSLIVLEGVTDDAALTALAAAEPGVEYLNKTAEVSGVFQDYRHRATLMIVIGYAVITLLLMIRYGWRTALLLVLPPALAAAAGVAVSGWLGMPWNLFSVLALFLVLGIGIDYTLFLAEARSHRAQTMLAVWLSALTTILAFGLLAWSRTPAVHTFGVTVFAGIAMALWCAPIVLWSKRRAP